MLEKAWSLREAIGVGIVAIGAGMILRTFGAQYPLREWLLFHVLEYWLLAAYWAVGCFSAGAQLMQLLAPRGYNFAERAVLSFALGVLLFGAVTFLVGLLHQLGPVFFATCPGFFIAFGTRTLLRHRRAAIRRARSLARRPMSALLLGATVFGALCLVMVYLPILSPQNVQHDARWYHLPIAQQYASSGAISAFREGWFLGAYPHLSSILYTWALLLPAGIVHRIGLAAHMEFIVFLWTVAALPILVRRLLPRLPIRGAWPGLFLFPGLFVYDSNLSLGADHVAALWAGPVVVTCAVALKELQWKHCLLLGALVGGAAWTKYSAICLVGPVVLAFGVVSVRRVVRHRAAVRGAVAFLLSFLITWAPHWLKNLIWHGDPLYPYLNRHLTLNPWSTRAASHFSAFLQHDVLGPAEGLSGIIEGAATALTLGFSVNEYGFHGKIPTFGFLFPVCLACLPFVRANRRIYGVFGLCVVGALFWYWTNHRDRYLQAILPWLAAGTVSVLILVWRSNVRFAKLSVGVLVGTQLACGLGLFFIRSHIMIPGKHPLEHVGNLIDAGYQGEYARRFEPYADWGFASWVALGKNITGPGKVLVHEERLWVGLDAPVVVDEPAWQAGIDYARFGSPEALRRELMELGVSHIVTGQNHPGGGDHDPLGELVFWELVAGNCRKVVVDRRLTLWQVPTEPVHARPNSRVFLGSCGAGMPRGVYELKSDGARTFQPDLADPGGTDLAVTQDRCTSDAELKALASFKLLAVRGAVRFWQREQR